MHQGDRSLSQLVKLAATGSASAENCLAGFFFSKAIAATRKKLTGKLPVEDQEDVAISAVKSFCLGIRDGEIEYQGDKQLFALLHKIVDGKIRKLWQYHLAGKRDLRRVEVVDVMVEAQAPDVDHVMTENIQVTPDEQPAVDRILGDLQFELRGLFAKILSELDEHPRRLPGRSVASIERYRQLIRQKLERPNHLA